MLVTIISIIMYALSLGLLFAFIKQNEYVTAVDFMILAVTTMMSAGLLIEAVAKTESVATFGFRLSHIGFSIIAILLLSLTTKLCNAKLPAFLWVIVVTLSTAILVLSCLGTTWDGYYREFKLVHYNGYSRIETVNGPFHILFWINLLIDSAIGTFLIIRAARNRLKVSRHIVYGLIVAQLLIVLLPTVDLFAKRSVELGGFAPVLAMISILHSMSFVELHDIDDCIACARGNLQEAAYIVFDNKKRYINATESAKKIFPKLRKLETDKIVPKSDSIFYNDVMRLVNSDSENASTLVCVMENYYVIKKISLRMGKLNPNRSGVLIEIHDVTANNSYLNELNKYNKMLEVEVVGKKKDIANLQEQLVLGMATIVESRDNTTGEHIVRTSSVVRKFADLLMFDSQEYNSDFLDMVVKAVPMHDLGKIAVEDKVLRKTGKYDEDDYREMRKHPAEGARIVRKILAGSEEKEFAEVAANIANFHHERWDGTGYPDKLKGEEIPVEARIMSLADALDAILSERAYEWPRGYNEAFELIAENLGTQFDPKLGRLFVKNKEAFEAIYGPKGKVE